MEHQVLRSESSFQEAVEEKQRTINLPMIVEAKEERASTGQSSQPRLRLAAASKAGKHKRLATISFLQRPREDNRDLESV